MGTGTRRWLRGTLTLGVLAMLAAAVLITNAAAVSEGKEASKKYVKKRINKLGTSIATTVANSAVQNDNNIAEGIFAISDEDGGGVPDTLDTVATLDLPAGRYAVFAKLGIYDSTQTESDCELVVGSDRDEGSAYGEEGDVGTPDAQQTMTLMIVPTLTTANAVVLSCDDGGTGDQWEWLKIVAVRQPTLSNVAV